MGNEEARQTCGSRISELATKVFGLAAHFGFKHADLKIEVHSSGEVRFSSEKPRASAPLEPEAQNPYNT